MELIVETSVFDDERLSDDVQEVQQVASTAMDIAGNNSQYFWCTETGTDTGVHITLTPQDTFKANPSGYNLLARNNGVEVRDGLTACSVFTNGGTYFNAVINGTNQLITKYEITGAQIGAELAGYRNMTIDNTNGIRFRNGTTVLAKYDVGSVIFYDSTGAYELANFSPNGMLLKNNSNITTFEAGNNGIKLYDATSYPDPIMSVDGSGLTLRDSNGRLMSTLTTTIGRVGSYEEDAEFYVGTGSIIDLEEIMRDDFPTELGAASGYFGGKFARFNTPSNGYSGNYGGGIKIQSKFSHGTAPYGGYGDTYLMLFSGGGTEDIPSAHILLKSDFNYAGQTYSSAFALRKGNIYLYGTKIYKNDYELYVVSDESSSQSVSANATSTHYISISKTGYTPIGVVGFDVDGSGIASAKILACNISYDTTNLYRVYFQVRNDGSANTWTFKCKILWQAN